MFYLGIDVSKNSARYLIIDDTGKKVTSFSLENTREKLSQMLEQLEKFNLNKDDLLAGIEATANFWENIYSFLKQQRVNVVLLNPYYVNKFHEALGKKAKTDDIDALVIAQFLRTGEYKQSQVADEFVQSLRELTTLRHKLLQQRKNYQREVFSLLTVVFPEYSKTVIKNPFAVASIAILKKYPTAIDIAQAKPKHIEKIVRSIQGNNFNIDEIEKLIATAKNSIYSGRVREARTTTLRVLLSQIELLSKSINEIENEINKILNPQTQNDNRPGSNLFSIPGVGEKTIAAVLSYLGINADNFSNQKDVIGYIGYYPKIFETGQTRKENKISKRGPKLLRSTMYLCAVASIKHNPEMRTLYNKKLSQGKSEKQALIYVGKKLLQIIRAMLKSGETYNPARVFVQSF
jgi:transposase